MLFTAIALIILVGAAFKPYQSISDFSGHWILNKEKSVLGGLPPGKAAAFTIKIIQKADSLKMEREFDGLSLSIESYGYKGDAVDQAYPRAKVSRKLTRSEDKKVMTISSKYQMTPENAEAWEYTRTETYDLTDEGNTLILERLTVTPDGTEKVKAVYTKMK